jgi:hypothetical protein
VSLDAEFAVETRNQTLLNGEMGEDGAVEKYVIELSCRD